MHDDTTHAGLGCDAPHRITNTHTSSQSVCCTRVQIQRPQSGRTVTAQHPAVPTACPSTGPNMPAAACRMQDGRCFLSLHSICASEQLLTSWQPAGPRKAGTATSIQQHLRQEDTTAAHAHLPPRSRATGRQAGLAHQSHSTHPLVVVGTTAHNPSSLCCLNLSSYHTVQYAGPLASGP